MKNLAVYIKLNPHQRTFNRVFRSHQIVYVIFLVLNSHRVVEMRLLQKNEKESSGNDLLTISNSH